MSAYDWSYLPDAETDSTSSDSSSDSEDDRKPTRATTPPTQSHEEEQDAHTVCFKCRVRPIEFVTDSCRCPVFCRTCAMKMASGGYCPVCKEFYRSFKHV